LALHEQLDSKEGMARSYGNLGVVHLARGDLDKAEEMHRKALVLHEEIDNKEGVADSYGDLGLVSRNRGDLESCCSYWHLSCDLYIEIGMPHMAKKVDSWMREAKCAEEHKARKKTRQSGRRN